MPLKKLLQKDVFDALSKKVRELHPACQINDGREHSGYLQGGHIFSRTYHGVAFSLADVVTICFAHHRYYTDRYLEWEEYWLAWDAQRWNRLHAIVYAIAVLHPLAQRPS